MTSEESAGSNLVALSPDSAAFDEDSLDAELVAAEIHQRRRSRWSWLHGALGIWLVTTTTVGAVGYLYSNYAGCRVTQVNDDNQLAKITYELANPSIRLDDYMTGIAITSGDFSAKNLVHRARLYFDEAPYFSDYKGRKPRELLFDVQRIMTKWGRWNTNNTELPYTPYWILKNFSESDLIQRYRADRTGVWALVDLGSNYDWPEVILRNDGEGDRAMVDQWLIVARAMRQIATLATDSANKGVIGPASCLRRSIWPF